MTGIRKTLAIAGGLVLAMPAWGAGQHYAIRTESIAAAMSSVGMQIPPEQVTLLTDVVATTNAPRLRVRSMDRSADHGLMVRFECENAAECVPFFARIGFKTDNDSQVHGATAQVEVNSRAAGRANPVAIRAGSTATLLLDSERVHVRIAVVCLENGAPGQKIRVAAGDRKQIYLAEVIDGRFLKGRL